MLHLLYALLATVRSSLRSQRELALENLALRQQLAVLKRRAKRPASWLSRGRPSVVCLDWTHDIALVLDENEKLKRRTERQTAIIRLLVVLVKLSGFRLDEQRPPDGTPKARVDSSR